MGLRHPPVATALMPYGRHRFTTASKHGGDIGERDEESERTEESFVALLRRVADAIEDDKGWRVMVNGVRFTVPEDARLSVEHEVNGKDHELELQFKWTAAGK